MNCKRNVILVDQKVILIEQKDDFDSQIESEWQEDDSDQQIKKCLAKCDWVKGDFGLIEQKVISYFANHLRFTNNNHFLLITFDFWGGRGAVSFTSPSHHLMRSKMLSFQK